MKTLITGTPGWLASRLIEALAPEHRDIRCLVQPDVDAGSLARLGLEVVRGDVTSPQSLRGICKDVSTVFHCAGMIHPRDPRQFYTVNTSGTRNLAEAAIANRVEKFIYVSSNVAGIGDHWPRPVSESDKPAPFMHYGLSKLKAEEALDSYYRKGMLKIVIIRPNWLYGIKGPGRQLQFIRMIKKGRPIYFNEHDSFHSLCDINNCVSAMLLAEKSEKAAGQRYYIADSRPYNILETYETIADILNVECHPRHILSFAYNSPFYRLANALMQGVRFYRPEIHMAWEWSKNLVCSIDKARREIGYNPVFDLKEGMRAAIKWYAENGIAID